MKIVLLAGIYPPELGGPATYSQALARELAKQGHQVCVLAYGEREPLAEDGFSVQFVSRSGTFIARYIRFLRAIHHTYISADIVYNFGTVSTGIPLWFSKVPRAKKILRLGGDFAWERYTDWGGTLALDDFYKTPSVFWRFVQLCMKPLISQHRHIIFSTEWQSNIYTSYIQLSSASVIENAVEISGANSQQHSLHSPIKLLSYGRLVAFKNISTLVAAMKLLPDAQLTIVGSGPCLNSLKSLVIQSGLRERICFLRSVDRIEQAALFAEHDMLIIPSISDISPNAALEAKAHGLPVIITQNNGLSSQLQAGMHVCNTSTPEYIAQAVHAVHNAYDTYTDIHSIVQRSWQQVAKDHEALFFDTLQTAL